VAIVEVHGYSVEDMPLEGKEYARVGLKCVYPTGVRWREIISEQFDQHVKHAKLRCDRALMEMVMYDTMDVVRSFQTEVRNVRAIISAVKKKKSRRDKAVGVGQEAPPKSLLEAFNHPTRAVDWWNAALEEFEGLTEMGVFDHDYTRAMLDELDITTIIPLAVVLDHKYGAAGLLDRLKVRMAVAGHKGNLRKGEHFDKTFAATPNSNSMRLMQALLVYHKWLRRSFDIKQAYCWAEFPKEALLAYRNPKGLGRAAHGVNRIINYMG